MPNTIEKFDPLAVMDLISQKAEQLDGAFHDPDNYSGTERSLAAEVIDAIAAEDKPKFLAWMVEWDHLAPRVHSVDCLLNECNEQTYKTVAAMANLLLDEIKAQHGEDDALRILVTNAICHERDAISLLRSTSDATPDNPF